MKYLCFLFIPILFLSCTPTKYSFNEYFTPDYEKEIIRTITIMEIISDELTEVEKINLKNKFIDEIRLRYKNVAFYDSQKYLKSNENIAFNEMWTSFWQNFIQNENVDPVTLFDLSEIVKSNAVLQIGIVDVDKIFGEHRKTIGQTSVELKIGLFSLKSGRLLWKANVSGTQANAHSDQVIPKVVEAVNVAINNLINRLPFN